MFMFTRRAAAFSAKSLPMSLKKEKTKKFAVHACGRAGDGGHERHGMVVSVGVAVFVDLPLCLEYQRKV